MAVRDTDTSPPLAARSARTRTSAPAGDASVGDVSAIDWRRVARHALVSRALDDAEEETNRNRASVPREHVVLYQFSARGHDVAQCILGALLDHPRDAAGAYYRSRPLLLSLGLPLDDALASPLGRSGGFSDGRDIGVVCNLPRANGPQVLPMAGDVGGQYTPVAGWAQSIRYHRDVLGDARWRGAIGVALGGEASVATSGFWSALTIATTLALPMLFYVEDNGLGISVPSSFQTPGGNIAANLAAFSGLRVLDGDGTDPADAAARLTDAMAHVRRGDGPALVRLTVPRLSSHSGPDNQKGYRTAEAIAADLARDPLPRLKRHVLARGVDEAEWNALEQDVARDVADALAAARDRPVSDPARVRRFVVAEPRVDGDLIPVGGLSDAERVALGGTDVPAPSGPALRFTEAVRRTLARELEVNPKLLVFGEDVGVKGGVHLVTEGLQKHFGAARVFDTSLSEEGIVGRAVGMAYSGLVPVVEIQFRKYADPATEQLNNCGTVRWRTANQFCAPIVVRMPGGFGKDVGDPWHSLSDEVRFAHALGWQVAIPSNAADAVGLLRAAMRSPNPTIFFEHRALLMTSDGSAPYPGDEYVLPFGRAARLREGSRVTVVTWGALTHRCVEAADRLVERYGGDAIDVLDLRTVSPWDRAAVLASVEKTGRCLIVHEDTRTAGFGAEIAAVLARDAFWWLDAPVERYCVDDVPMPYHPSLLDAVLPNVDGIVERIEALLRL
ncbi:pyruvate dehydrogenase E1 subunit beta [Gemmatimonadetes bacterium T265]|nr:pyruvate dehydrogenase E1 subunit beta [Gemmatimonadetes bacterium T265]